METRTSADPGKTPAGNAPAGAVLDASRQELASRVEGVIDAELPEELRSSARDLLRAVLGKVAVAEHFDAFCGTAFSKREWAAAASPVIAELFDADEDQLAELARIPDLVIELGTGQATVTCMVASRWAARGETHRLSRLAESIVASHAAKNASAVEVMLALAATLAVTRFSKAEQLYNAALPLAGEEHREALQDARRWLAAGRIVCSASQEERDFWDVRLRRPKAAWAWQSKDELQALDTLAERLAGNAEDADLYRAVVPACWWQMAMKCAQVQEKLTHALKRPVPTAQTIESQRISADSTKMPERPQEFLPPHPQAGSYARFVLGWICGAMAMVITLFLVPSETLNRLLDSIKVADAQAHPGTLMAANWQQESLKKMVADMGKFSSAHAAAKQGSWRANEMMLSGHGKELPFDSPEYMKFLVWLHLDPPLDEEVRMQVCRLLLERVRSDAITLWEELIYSGAPNTEQIRQAARDALNNAAFQWGPEEKRRLAAIAEGSADKAMRQAGVHSR